MNFDYTKLLNDFKRIINERSVIKQDEVKEKLIEEMREYAKEHEKDILIEMRMHFKEKVKELQALASELGFDVVKKGTTEKVL